MSVNISFPEFTAFDAYVHVLKMLTFSSVSFLSNCCSMNKIFLNVIFKQDFILVFDICCLTPSVVNFEHSCILNPDNFFCT